MATWHAGALGFNTTPREPGVVVHPVCNPSTRETAAGRSGVQVLVLQLKVFALKPDNLSLIPGTQRGRQELTCANRLRKSARGCARTHMPK